MTCGEQSCSTIHSGASAYVATTEADAACVRAACRGAASCAQVQEQVQVQMLANVQDSAWQQQCARAMCSGEQAVDRSDPCFRVASRVVYLGTRLGTSQRVADRRACKHQLIGLPRARGQENCLFI